MLGFYRRRAISATPAAPSSSSRKIFSRTSRKKTTPAVTKLSTSRISGLGVNRRFLSQARWKNIISVSKRRFFRTLRNKITIVVTMLLKNGYPAIWQYIPQSFFKRKTMRQEKIKRLNKQLLFDELMFVEKCLILLMKELLSLYYQISALKCKLILKKNFLL